MTFIERIKAATIGFNGYARLGRDNAGGFGFMAFILFVAMTVSCIWNTVDFVRGIGNSADEMAQIPDFTFSNGQVEFKEKMPYVIDEGGTIIIVDTTGQTGPGALSGHANGMLITKTRLYQVQPGRGMRETDLSTIPFTLTKNSIIGFVQKMWIAIPVGYVFMFLFQLGFKALDACILGLVGLIYGSSTGKQVDFGLAFKLGLYAITIPTLLQWIIPGFSTIPFTSTTGTLGFLGWWALAIIYLIFGLQAYFKNPDGMDPNGYYAGTP
ncbi:MAG TPA: DUF1189 domain-containing protein [Symbiobacteriaceae bacterium]|nr:DUF1189 domain-containing protein [Symbiobacteriaceae bacterium]